MFYSYDVYTQVGSRRVIQAGAIIMLILSLLNKFCAVFVTIPDPIVGGVYFVMFGKLILIIITDCFEKDYMVKNKNTIILYSCKVCHCFGHTPLQKFLL